MSQNYLILGNNNILIKEQVNNIVDKFLSKEDKSLNYSKFLPDNINNIFNSLKTMPFIAEKRVVLVENIQTGDDDFFKSILSYLNGFLDSSVLILVADVTLKKNKHYIDLTKKVELINISDLNLYNIKKWIESFLEKNNIKIEKKALDLLIELKDLNFIDIVSELEKLICFANKEEIKIKHVEQLVGSNIKEDVFKLIDAINAKNTIKLFNIISNLYAQKKQSYEILGYIAWYVKTMQKIIMFYNQGFNVHKTAKALGYSFAYTKRLFDQLKQHSSKKIKQWVILLLEADKEMKKGIKESRLIIELLLIRFLVE